MKTAFTLDGFDVRAEMKDDDSPDLSYLGEYKDKAPTNAPYWDRALERVVDPKKPEQCEACGGTSFAPECGETDCEGNECGGSGVCDCACHKDCEACGGTGERQLTEDEQRAVDRFGYRHEYRYVVGGCGDPAYLEQDAKRLEDYENGEWRCVGIVVTASRAGVKLGRASVWGIESDADDAHFDEMVDECAAEAVAEAKVKLAALIAGEK